MAAHMSRYPLSFSWDLPHPEGTPLTFGIWGDEADHVVRCPSSTGGFFLGRAAEFGEGGALLCFWDLWRFRGSVDLPLDTRAGIWYNIAIVCGDFVKST